MARVEAERRRLGLTINPIKCASLHMSGQQPVGTHNTVFTIDGVANRTLAESENMLNYRTSSPSPLQTFKSLGKPPPTLENQLGANIAKTIVYVYSLGIF